MAREGVLSSLVLVVLVYYSAELLKDPGSLNLEEQFSAAKGLFMYSVVI
jgi:hypothetical protein